MKQDRVPRFFHVGTVIGGDHRLRCDGTRVMASMLDLTASQAVALGAVLESMGKELGKEAISGARSGGLVVWKSLI